MVNQDFGLDLIARNAEITAIIPQNNPVSDRTPFPRRVEPLIDPSVKSERAFTNDSTEREVLKALFERLDCSEF